MLTTFEIVFFCLFVVISLTFTARGIQQISNNISSAQGSIQFESAIRQLPSAIWRMVSLDRTFKTRPTSTIIHALIAWGFLTFLFINLNDIVFAMTSYRIVDKLGWFGNFYRSIADVFNVLILVSMILLLARRFLWGGTTFSPRDNAGLSMEAKKGIARDSAIVGGFIILHNGARFIGEAAFLARTGSDSYQFFASLLASQMSAWKPTYLVGLEHAGFWLSMGAILAFLPYFPKSKHIHLFFVPISRALKPVKIGLAPYPPINLEDETITLYGANTLADLPYGQIIDAYACIMCYRCQEVCPAYATGKPLSPATLEINKRYALNQGNTLENVNMLNLISADAIWSCTTCGACVDICPVGNEPLIDIIEIRRNLAMMESQFPRQLETAFKGMERNANPWNVSPATRENWKNGLNVPTIEENPEPDVLWWVGCAPATDPRAQKTARAFADILNHAGVNFAILGKLEACTGDSARRAGREDIYYQLASQNIETLNEVNPKLIVTTCPHCQHTLANEYPELGGHYSVIHHSTLINQLVGQGKIQFSENSKNNATYHDPCYLGRHNGNTEDARSVFEQAKIDLKEMQHSGMTSTCCGAGGSQFWKEELGPDRNNLKRYLEAKDTATDELLVGCPFCLTMLTDASKSDTNPMQITDIAEFVAQNMIRK